MKTIITWSIATLLTAFVGCTRGPAALSHEDFLSEFVKQRKSQLFELTGDSSININVKIEKLDSGSNVISITETDSEGQSWDYAILEGITLVGNKISDRLQPPISIITKIDPKISALEGHWEKTIDINQDGNPDYLNVFSAILNHTMTGFGRIWLSTSKNEYQLSNLESTSQCEAGICEDCIGKEEILSVKDDHIEVLAKTIFSDAQCSSTIESIRRNYAWLKDDQRFELIGEENLSAPPEQTEDLDELLSILDRGDFVEITEKDGTWVHFQICGGGMPTVRIYKEEFGWMMSEMGYQDMMQYQIQKVTIEGTQYTLTTDNPDIPYIKFTFDAGTSRIKYRKQVYAANPDSYPTVNEEPCDM